MLDAPQVILRKEKEEERDHYRTGHEWAVSSVCPQSMIKARKLHIQIKSSYEGLRYSTTDI